MIKFFQQLRRKLMTQGNLKTYVFYAFGEVLLVMIGILLALQVNTWNKNRNDKNEERAYLNSLLVDLTVDSLNYDRMGKYMSQVVEVNNSILRKFKEDKPIEEQDFKAAYSTFTIPPVRGQSSTFNEMQSSGKLNLIKDNTLKNQILLYYAEREYIRKVETLNNNVITRLPLSFEIDINSFLHLNIDYIEEVNDLSYDFFNKDRGSPEIHEYINSISFRSLMSIGNKSIYDTGLRQSSELKNSIHRYLTTF